MLFSNKQIADYIDSHFEPAWQSVRPVPIVKVDFGNGHIVTRTLNGNIASYVCSPDGQVLDVLPGMYDEKTYLADLDQLYMLFFMVRKADYLQALQPGQRLDSALLRPAVSRTVATVSTGSSGSTIDGTILTDYHKRQAENLEAQKDPLQLVMKRTRPQGFTKISIEAPLKIILEPAMKNDPEIASAPAATASKGDLHNWQTLKSDSLLNDRARRLIVHRKLARAGPVTPAEVTSFVYREALNTDIGDPYLGLGHVLSATYPFSQSQKLKTPARK